LGRNGLDISEDGVLLSKKGQEKEDVKDSVKPSEASNQPGTRSVRASTKGPAATDQPDATSTPAAGGTEEGATVKQPVGSEAKSGESKKDAKKDSKKKKEKRGFLGGIFK